MIPSQNGLDSSSTALPLSLPSVSSEKPKKEEQPLQGRNVTSPKPDSPVSQQSEKVEQAKSQSWKQDLDMEVGPEPEGGAISKAAIKALGPRFARDLEMEVGPEPEGETPKTAQMSTLRQIVKKCSEFFHPGRTKVTQQQNDLAKRISYVNNELEKAQDLKTKLLDKSITQSDLTEKDKFELSRMPIGLSFRNGLANLKSAMSSATLQSKENAHLLLGEALGELHKLRSLAQHSKVPEEIQKEAAEYAKELDTHINQACNAINQAAGREDFINRSVDYTPYRSSFHFSRFGGTTETSVQARHDRPSQKYLDKYIDDIVAQGHLIKGMISIEKGKKQNQLNSIEAGAITGFESLQNAIKGLKDPQASKADAIRSFMDAHSQLELLKKQADDPSLLASQRSHLKQIATHLEHTIQHVNEHYNPLALTETERQSIIEVSDAFKDVSKVMSQQVKITETMSSLGRAMSLDLGKEEQHITPQESNKWLGEFLLKLKGLALLGAGGANRNSSEANKTQARLTSAIKLIEQSIPKSKREEVRLQQQSRKGDLREYSIDSLYTSRFVAAGPVTPISKEEFQKVAKEAQIIGKKIENSIISAEKSEGTPQALNHILQAKEQLDKLQDWVDTQRKKPGHESLAAAVEQSILVPRKAHFELAIEKRRLFDLSPEDAQLAKNISNSIYGEEKLKQLEDHNPITLTQILGVKATSPSEKATVAQKVTQILNQLEGQALTDPALAKNSIKMQQHLAKIYQLKDKLAKLSPEISKQVANNREGREQTQKFNKEFATFSKWAHCFESSKWALLHQTSALAGEALRENYNRLTSPLSKLDIENMTQKQVSDVQLQMIHWRTKINQEADKAFDLIAAEPEPKVKAEEYERKAGAGELERKVNLDDQEPSAHPSSRLMKTLVRDQFKIPNKEIWETTPNEEAAWQKLQGMLVTARTKEEEVAILLEQPKIRQTIQEDPIMQQAILRKELALLYRPDQPDKKDLDETLSKLPNFTYSDQLKDIAEAIKAEKSPEPPEKGPAAQSYDLPSSEIQRRGAQAFSEISKQPKTPASVLQQISNRRSQIDHNARLIKLQPATDANFQAALSVLHNAIDEMDARQELSDAGAKEEFTEYQAIAEQTLGELEAIIQKPTKQKKEIQELCQSGIQEVADALVKVNTNLSNYQKPVYEAGLGKSISECLYDLVEVQKELSALQRSDIDASDNSVESIKKQIEACRQRIIDARDHIDQTLNGLPEQLKQTKFTSEEANLKVILLESEQKDNMALQKMFSSKKTASKTINLMNCLIDKQVNLIRANKKASKAKQSKTKEEQELDRMIVAIQKNEQVMEALKPRLQIIKGTANAAVIPIHNEMIRTTTIPARTPVLSLPQLPTSLEKLVLLAANNKTREGLNKSREAYQQSSAKFEKELNDNPITTLDQLETYKKSLDNYHQAIKQENDLVTKHDITLCEDRAIKGENILRKDIRQITPNSEYQKKLDAALNNLIIAFDKFSPADKYQFAKSLQNSFTSESERKAILEFIDQQPNEKAIKQELIRYGIEYEEREHSSGPLRGTSVCQRILTQDYESPAGVLARSKLLQGVYQGPVFLQKNLLSPADILREPEAARPKIEAEEADLGKVITEASKKMFVEICGQAKTLISPEQAKLHEAFYRGCRAAGQSHAEAVKKVLNFFYLRSINPTIAIPPRMEKSVADVSRINRAYIAKVLQQIINDKPANDRSLQFADDLIKEMSTFEKNSPKYLLFQGLVGKDPEELAQEVDKEQLQAPAPEKREQERKVELDHKLEQDGKVELDRPEDKAKASEISKPVIKKSEPHDIVQQLQSRLNKVTPYINLINSFSDSGADRQDAFVLLNKATDLLVDKAAKKSIAGQDLPLAEYQSVIKIIEKFEAIVKPILIIQEQCQEALNDVTQFLKTNDPSHYKTEIYDKAREPLLLCLAKASTVKAKLEGLQEALTRLENFDQDKAEDMTANIKQWKEELTGLKQEFQNILKKHPQPQPKSAASI